MIKWPSYLHLSLEETGVDERRNESLSGGLSRCRKERVKRIDRFSLHIWIGTGQFIGILRRGTRFPAIARSLPGGSTVTSASLSTTDLGPRKEDYVELSNY